MRNKDDAAMSFESKLKIFCSIFKLLTILHPMLSSFLMPLREKFHFLKHTHYRILFRGFEKNKGGWGFVWHCLTNRNTNTHINSIETFEHHFYCCSSRDLEISSASSKLFLSSMKISLRAHTHFFDCSKGEKWWLKNTREEDSLLAPMKRLV